MRSSTSATPTGRRSRGRFRDAVIYTVPADEVNPIRAALTEGMTITTSGSTARPKHVRLSGGALVASAHATAAAIGTGGWILALPLSYIAGVMVVVRALVADRPIIDARRDTFDAREFSRIVGGVPEGTWFTSLVPTQLQRLVDHAEGDTTARDALRRLDRILVGGQSVPPGLVKRATALGLKVTTTYGSAETAGGVVYDGRPIGATRIAVDDDGQIEIATSSLADGYLGDDDLTTESFVVRDGNRWWRTTDRGTFLDGVLTVTGRVDDIIITGGVKVSLADIERVLSARGIEAVASWFSNDTWGQVPALVSTTELERDVVRQTIEDELSKEARPYRFVTVPEIPRLTSGKVDRRAVHELVNRVES